MLGIGIKGAIWGAQALLAHMDPARGGAIINMASPVAERGFPNTAVYSLVKGALVTLTKTLAAELAPEGITVNTIAPGRIATSRIVELFGEEPAPDEVAEIPAGRFGRPRELGDAVAFLCSSRASYVTGTLLPVDGGLTRALA